MAKKHDLKCTYGNFKFVGKVSGVESERFYKEMTFDSGATKREVNFAVETSPNNKIFVKLEGWKPKSTVKFSKYDKTTKQREEKEVDFEDRFDFKEEGFYPSFGTRVGIARDEENELMHSGSYFQWDAVEMISDELEDGMSVVVEGSVNVNSYVKDGEKKKFVNYSINKIYTLKKELDFESEDFKEENKFTQKIVYMGIEKHPEDPSKFVVQAKLVTPDGVEDMEYTVENKNIANPVKKNLKPYNAIDVMCRVVKLVSEEEPEVDDDDAWGDDEDMDSNDFVKYESDTVITKVYKATLDKETYTEEALDAIVTADDDFGDDMDDDEEDVW